MPNLHVLNENNLIAFSKLCQWHYIVIFKRWAPATTIPKGGYQLHHEIRTFIL